MTRRVPLFRLEPDSDFDFREAAVDFEVDIHFLLYGNRHLHRPTIPKRDSRARIFIDR